MKKIFFFLGILILIIPACHADEALLEMTDLPIQATVFIEKYFPDTRIVSIEYEKEGNREEYTIDFANGAELELGANGSFEAVDCKVFPVPEGIVPKKIADDVALRYDRSFIVSYAVDYDYIELEMSNGDELHYNHAYEFIRFDD